jgi:ER-bound oxygenase mpaB/B'/Rubber oxygenase, catalytic domain
MAEIAARLGVVNPPRTERELTQRINAFRPELRSTPEARDAARFLLLTPPLPLAARAPYGALAATAVAMLPVWARMPLLLPYFPPVELTVVRTVGRALVGGIRWALPAPG